MSQVSRPDTIRHSAHDTEPMQMTDSSLERIARLTDLIQLIVGVLNGLIGLRFLLKLMAIASTNPLASAVYAVTSPFLGIFRGLTGTSSMNGMDAEFFSLIAILVYAMAGWILVQLVWILFARRK